MKHLLIVLLLLPLVGCDWFSVLDGRRGGRTVSVGTPFELALGETARLGPDSLRITFAAVEEESRCPEGVVCAWAGEAVIQLLLKPSNGDRFALRLSIPGLVQTPFTQNDAVEAAGYRFKLLRLLPYPRAGHSIPEPRYRALLAVEEN